MVNSERAALITSIRGVLRITLMKLRILYLRMVWGHELHPTALISFSAYLDRTNPKSIYIGAYTIITRGAVVLSHDYTRSVSARTQIGRNCLIGVNAIIMPGSLLAMRS